MFENYYGYQFARGEKLPKELLEYEYLELNLNQREIARKYNIAPNRVGTNIRHYGLKKTPEQVTECKRKTCLQKYGVDNPNKCPKIKNKNMESYVNNHPELYMDFSLLYELYINQNLTMDEIIEKVGCTKKQIRNTLKLHGLKKDKSRALEAQQRLCEQKYGIKYICAVPQVRNKIQEKFNQKYGGNAPMCCKEIQKKMEQTNLKRYGVKAPCQNEQIKQKLLDTRMEKYGTLSTWDIPGSKEKYTKTCLERYGCENAMQSPGVKDKVKQTNLEHFGVEYSFQAEEVKEKSRKTCLERYGVDIPSKSPEVQRKIFESMKENGSLGKSGPEKEILLLLQSKFECVKTQYNEDERYPFLTDFYIPQLDLFIEYQGYEGHGDHPFDPNNQIDLNLVEFWKQKSMEINYKGELKNQYAGYIKIWTIKDPLKRQIAKDNKLNWIEFFNMDEFMEWYNSL